MEPRLADKFREDLDHGLFLGKALTRIAAPVFGLLLVIGVIAHVSGRDGGDRWGSLIGVPLVVLGGYAMAGLGVGIGLFLTRPLRKWFIGWLLIGYLLGCILYGSVGLADALGFQYFGISFLDSTSVSYRWEHLLPMTAMLGLGGMVLGGVLWFQTKRQQKLN